jgi:uncharacterized cupin superfamily protein
MPNIYKPQFEEGQAAYPYHNHYADEELLDVISGEPSLRTPEGTRTLEEGEVVHFPLGEEGAHQREDAVGYFEREQFPPDSDER